MDESPLAGKPSLASFFSGIGGIEIGFENAGFQTVFQCENDSFCASILQKHWPSIRRWHDIKELKHETIPFADVWAGGFPCQDLSLARGGARAGLRGQKSGLFHEFVGLIAERCPRIVLLENVHGLLNAHGGRDFETVIRALAELGYAVGWRVFNSKNFGVPQSRQRVFVVGCHRDRRGPAKILFEPECGEGHSAPSKCAESQPLPSFKDILGDVGGEGPVVQGLAYCLCATSGRHTGTDWSRTYISYPKRGDVRRLTPRECEGVMGFPFGWTVPSEGNIAEDDLDSFRYKALGNAVTPPVAEWIARRILSYIS